MRSLTYIAFFPSWLKMRKISFIDEARSCGFWRKHFEKILENIPRISGVFKLTNALEVHCGQVFVVE